MPPDFLEKIVEQKKTRIGKKGRLYASLKKKFQSHHLRRYHFFKKAISRAGMINLIAEIKKASPSCGVIRQDFDVLKLARTYVQHNAAALSILTEEDFFQGNIDFVKAVHEKFHIPILMKDFFLDEGQIYEAFVCGASAILLVVAALQDWELKNFIEVASRLNLDCLVEVHSEEDLERALSVGAEIIGINNRDLRTFKVDLKVSERLIPKIFQDKVIVVESGIQSADEVQKFKRLGGHAVLIGETFLRATDVGQKIEEVMAPTDSSRI